MLQNAVGYDGFGSIEGRAFYGYGGNQNRVERGDGFTRILMSVPDHRGPRFDEELSLLYSGPEQRAFSTAINLDVKRLSARGAAPDCDALWIDGAGGATSSRLLIAAVDVMNRGGVVLFTRPEKEFLDFMARIEEQGKESDGGWMPECAVFEDFESGSYARWTVEGDAFGETPHSGTTPGQNLVAGFLGEGLVNSYLPGDAPQGSMTSEPFTVKHRYIGFLIGGGAHRGETCLNLKVGGQVVRTATGGWDELLQPAQWDVSDLAGQEAVFEIVDRASGGWGHINVDHIVFGDTPPKVWLGKQEALRRLAPSLAALPRSGVESDPEGMLWELVQGVATDGADSAATSAWRRQWKIGTILLDLGSTATTGDRLGWIAAATQVGYTDGTGLPPEASSFGSMCLSLFDGAAGALCEWTQSEKLATMLRESGTFGGPPVSKASPAGSTVNGALAAPFTLRPGEQRSVTFLITWCFPNLERFGHERNLYADRFDNASAAEEYVRRTFERLHGATRLYHDTLYATNLPYWMVDCLSSQSCIPRTVLCFFAARHSATEMPYFAGYEGCYGCCPLNCTHVWNYAQTHARLFPSLGRNLRRYDFLHYLKDDGETQHRQHRPHGAFIDGHCAVIEGAYREHLMSADDAFLREIWPGVKMATEWLIAKIDSDEDGVNATHQWNTYDVATSGAHTFIGSQYLSALAAAEKMALVIGDEDAAARWAAIRELGMQNQDLLLWNGEYYIQIPGKKPARDYNNGCHSDQLLGQWWAHMLGTGYLYPPDHIRTALRSVFKYNLRDDFEGFHQRPRRYVLDAEGGLLMCTWPEGDRCDPFILYADEVWTGIEYSTRASRAFGRPL